MRLKRLRQAKGWTQRRLADKAEISLVYLAQIEGSAKNPPVRTPSLRTLERLAKSLGLPVGELLG